jgi:hypothetical protein
MVWVIYSLSCPWAGLTNCYAYHGLGCHWSVLAMVWIRHLLLAWDALAMVGQGLALLRAGLAKGWSGRCLG